MHTSRIPPDEMTLEAGVPTTTVPRTLLDLASVIPTSQLERVIDRADALRLTDRLSLADMVTRHRGRRGVGAIRTILERDRAGIAITRSELEDRFLAFLDRYRLRRPATNVPVEAQGRRYEVDCVWRAARVIVELDGHAIHSTRRAFERDRARDRALQAAGWRIVRVTWRQLHDDPDPLAADLSRLLDLRGPK